MLFEFGPAPDGEEAYQHAEDDIGERAPECAVFRQRERLIFEGEEGGISAHKARSAPAVASMML